MKVRCPACQTAFRVNRAQLDAHDGMVRCGNCYTPFNARDNFVEPPPSTLMAPETFDLEEPSFNFTPNEPNSTARSPRDEGLRFSAPDLPSSRATTPSTAPVWPNLAGSERPFEHSTGVPEAPAIPNSVTPSEADAELGLPLPPPSPFRRPSVAPPLSAALAEAPTEPPIELQTPDAFRRSNQADRQTLYTSARIRAERQAEAAGTVPTASVAASADDVSSDAAEPVDPRPEPQFSRESDEEFSPPPMHADREPDHTGELVSAAEEPEYHYTPVNPPPSTVTRWFQGLLLGVLLGLLLAQGAYLYRTELTRDWPELRPLFLQICERLGCELALPRMAALISIETSDLQSEPSKPTHYTLNALIRNQAQHAQTYPHLELTLTDSRDQAVARRVLPPEDWLPSGTKLEDGFAGRSAHALRLNFETRQLHNASGYRVYAFYP